MMTGKMETKWEKGILTLTITPDPNPTPSKTGKSLVLFSTLGFVDAGNESKISINLIKKR